MNLFLVTHIFHILREGAGIPKSLINKDNMLDILSPPPEF